MRHGESTANVAREEAERARADVIPVEARDADVPLSPRLGADVAAAVERARYGADRDVEVAGKFANARHGGSLSAGLATLNMQPQRG